MSDRLNDKLAAIAAEAESAEADQTNRAIPSHVTVSRPNRARSKVLQVRLNPDEFDALEQLAEQRGLPVSTIARSRLLGLLEEPAEEPLQRLMAAARDFARDGG